MSSRHPARPRRIDDALSQLIDSLTPPLTLSDLSPEASYSQDPEGFIAAAEERRHHENLLRAWHVVDAHATTPTTTNNNDLNSPIGPAGYGIHRRGSLAGENINNASDLIKRKLLRENASPDKAVRFSNLYSRLLTQPVLSQKWAILFLLYQLSGDEEPVDEEMLGMEEEGNRSPLVEEGNLQNMLQRGRHYSDEEGPAVSSSASQRPPAPSTRPERHNSLRRQEHERDGDEYERAREPQPQSRPARSRANTGPRENPMEEQMPVSQPSTEEQQKLVKPPEQGLLRDLPYNLQGLSSSNLEFSSSSTLKLPPTLPIPMVSLLNSLAEPCLLYRGLSSFVDSSDGGLVSQSLRAALSQELRSYLGLVATLEGEIRRVLYIPSDTDDNESRSVLKGGVTLKRCVIWTRDATMALRLMSLIVEEAQSKKGGQLISLIHGFSTSHGDPFVCAFAEKLLAHITRPFYEMLRHWIYDGELSDPFQEFFVVEPEFRPSTDPRRIATSVWEDKYKLDDNMVPSIITQEFARKVFLIGKSLNFIRYGCGDSGWVEAYSKETSKELRYGDTASLETSIDEAYKTTMARLIHLMDEKFKLFDHLHALKKYLLLGQGDFIALLMESLASNLDRPANSQYRHNLTAQLEHAIRASNAQYDSPDVLRRLDARMLELSHGEIGWDCFTLEYKIDAPVDVVITPWGSTQYLKVFNFLWRVKRVEFALGSIWRRCMTGARGVLGAVDDKVGADWKRARCAMAEIIHFVNQLQYYILFEVIEASWDQLQTKISKPGCTLDDLIEAHTNYLNSITHKGLLGSTSSLKKDPSTGKEEGFLTQLHSILKIMLAYKDVVDGLYSFSVAEFTRRQELSAKIENRTAQGRWGVSEHDSIFSSRRSTADNNNLDAGSDDHMLLSLRGRLTELSAEFRSRLNILLGDLAYQPDVDMRFLGVVMNFNDVYEPVRRRRVPASSSREKEKERERSRRKVAAANAAAGGNGGRSAGASTAGET